MEILAALLARVTLVALFLPFSALDKLLNFEAATDQAHRAVGYRDLARGLIIAGLGVEIFMSACILTGFADRAAAVMLAGYCMVTAVLWKQFWNTPDFRLRGPSQGREIFWDFLKNFAVAGGFLALAWDGPSASGVGQFFAEPFGSTHPYATAGAFR